MSNKVKEITALRALGKTWDQVGEALGLTPATVRMRYVRAQQKTQPVKPSTEPEPEAIEFTARLKKHTRYEELCEQLHISRRVLDAMLEDLEENGYLLDKNTETVALAKLRYADPEHMHAEWDGSKVIRFGVVSDSHINSKYAQISFLHEAYKRFAAEGITEVYNPGDIDEGEQMRKGHQYECYNQGADDHIDEIVRVYPHIEGITTYFITGNHDASFIKLAGIDIGKAVAKRRPDMIYLGPDNAVVHLTPNCRLELLHPDGGSAYAMSYKPQKIVEALEGGTKPNMLLIGHYHKAEYLLYRNVHVIQAGTTQAQSGFMRRNSLFAAVGYWIVEIEVNTDGHITRCKTEWNPCYKPIVDDYKEWAGYRGEE